MTHANAPLTPAGRLRLVQRCEHRPIARTPPERASPARRSRSGCAATRPSAKRAWRTVPARRASRESHPDHPGRGGPDRGPAPDPQVHRPPDPPRADPRGPPDRARDRRAVAAFGAESRRPGHRPHRRHQPQRPADRGPVSRTHGAPGRQEGRAHPRRRRPIGAPTAAARTRPRPSTAPRPRAPGLGMSTCTRPSTGSPASPTPKPCPTRPPRPRSPSGAGPGRSSPPTASPGSRAS